MQYLMELTREYDPNCQYYSSSHGASSSNSKPYVMSRSVSQKCPKPSKNSSYRSPLSRSASQKSSSKSSSSCSNSSSNSSLPRSSSQRCAETFTKKCSNMAKEQRAKFYIVKRCISMLVKWKKNSDS